MLAGVSKEVPIGDGDDYSDSEEEKTVEKCVFSAHDIRILYDYMAEKNKEAQLSETSEKEVIEIDDPVGRKPRNKPSQTPPPSQDPLQPSTSIPNTLLWQDQIAPACPNMLCGNSKGVASISRWLERWKKKSNPAKPPPGVNLHVVLLLTVPAQKKTNQESTVTKRSTTKR